MVHDMDPLRIPMANHALSTENSSPNVTTVKSFQARVPLSARESVKRVSIPANASLFNLPEPPVKQTRTRKTVHVVSSTMTRTAPTIIQAPPAPVVVPTVVSEPSLLRAPEVAWNTADFSVWLTAVEAKATGCSVEAAAFRKRRQRLLSVMLALVLAAFRVKAA
jgi:hypothetical protein